MIDFTPQNFTPYHNLQQRKTVTIMEKVQYVRSFSQNKTKRMDINLKNIEECKINRFQFYILVKHRLFDPIKYQSPKQKQKAMSNNNIKFHYQNYKLIHLKLKELNQLEYMNKMSDDIINYSLMHTKQNKILRKERAITKPCRFNYFLDKKSGVRHNNPLPVILQHNLQKFNNTTICTINDNTQLQQFGFYQNSLEDPRIDDNYKSFKIKNKYVKLSSIDKQLTQNQKSKNKQNDDSMQGIQYDNSPLQINQFQSKKQTLQLINHYKTEYLCKQSNGFF